MRKKKQWKVDFSYEGRVTPSPCPKCGKLIDAVSGPTKPKSGNLTICLYCGDILQFGKGMVLQPVDPEHWHFLVTEHLDYVDQLQHASAAVKMAKLGRQAQNAPNN